MVPAIGPSRPDPGSRAPSAVHQESSRVVVLARRAATSHGQRSGATGRLWLRPSYDSSLWISIQVFHRLPRAVRQTQDGSVHL